MAASNVIPMPFPAETRDRVFDAANTLWEQSGHTTPPTVDQVRRLARVDMNAASSLMREWRRDLTARAAPVPVQVPEAVAVANNAALAALWTQAQALANESLQAAQAAWEIERAQLEAMRAELAAAFDAQTEELERARGDAEAAAAAHQAALEAAHTKLADLQATAAEAINRADRADNKTFDLQEHLRALQVERETAALDTRAARSEVTEARTSAARLQGQVDALQQQLEALMRGLSAGRSVPDAGEHGQ